MGTSCGKRPLPLWTYQRGGITADDQPAGPRPLAGDWRDEFSLVYDAAAERGIGWQACDDAEIWVLASQLGANRPDKDADPLTDETGYTFNQRRAIALTRGEEPPSFDDEPMSAAEIAGMQKLMGGIEPMVPPS